MTKKCLKRNFLFYWFCCTETKKQIKNLRSMHTIYDIICNDSEKTFNHKEHATTNTNSEYESLLTPTEHFFEYEIIIKCFQLFNTKTI